MILGISYVRMLRGKNFAVPAIGRAAAKAAR
jgi:hypothetical protein